MNLRQLSQISDAAREGDILSALELQCFYVTGSTGYLSQNTLVLHPLGSTDNLYYGDGSKAEVNTMRFLSDEVLAHLGLQLTQDSVINPAQRERSSRSGLALRIGLLYRVLDRSNAHLVGRTSFGKSTLSQHAVRMKFSELNGVCLRLAEKLLVYEMFATDLTLVREHEELLDYDRMAEKLMGGHGYVYGGVHELTYLSMLFYCMNAR